MLLLDNSAAVARQQGCCCTTVLLLHNSAAAAACTDRTGEKKWVDVHSKNINMIHTFEEGKLQKYI